MSDAYKDSDDEKQLTTNIIDEGNNLEDFTPNQIIPQETLFSYVSKINEVYHSFSNENEINSQIFSIYETLNEFTFQDNEETFDILKNNDFFPIMNNMLTVTIQMQSDDSLQCILSLIQKITFNTTKIADLLVEQEVLDTLFHVFDSIPEHYFISVINLISNIFHDESLNILEQQIKEENIHIVLLDLIKYSHNYFFQNIILKTISTILIRLQNGHIGLSDVDGFVPFTLSAYIEKFDKINFENKNDEDEKENDIREPHSLTYLINCISSTFVLANYSSFDMNGIIDSIINFIMENRGILEEIDIAVIKAATNIVRTIRIPEIVEQIQDAYNFADEFNKMPGFDQKYQNSMMNLFLSILNFEIFNQHITIPPEAFES